MRVLVVAIYDMGEEGEEEENDDGGMDEEEGENDDDHMEGERERGVLGLVCVCFAVLCCLR